MRDQVLDRLHLCRIGNLGYLAFESDASNLAPSDANGTENVFVKDLRTGKVTLASADAANYFLSGGRRLFWLQTNAILPGFRGKAVTR